MRSIALRVAASSLALAISPCAAQEQFGAPPTPEFTVEEPPDPALRRDRDRFGDPSEGAEDALTVWASVGIGARTASGSSATLISPNAGLRLAVSDEFEALADFVVGYAASEFDGVFVPESATLAPMPYQASEERWEAGNPRLEFAWTPRLESFFARVGIGVAVPLAARELAPSDVPTAIRFQASELTLATLLAAYGGWNPWRFLPERLSVYLPLRFGYADEVVRFAADVGVGVGVSVLGGSEVDTAMVQAALDFGIQLVPELSVGARLQLAAWDLYDNRDTSALADPFQPSLAPWMRLTIGQGFAFLRAQLNAGGAYGNEPYVWALHVGGGANLEREPAY